MSGHLDGSGGESMESLPENASEHASIRSSPDMEEFEMEDEDGPLLSELESGRHRNPRSCRTGRNLLTGKRKWRSLLVLAALFLILLSLIAVGAALYAGDLPQSSLNGGSSPSPSRIPIRR